jgi:hypothetical protein
MPDLFDKRTPINGKHYDLFNNREIDEFRWIVAQFSGSGATRAIIKANTCNLSTYYPLRINKDGEPVPLWANYLFMEFREFVTIDICRNTPRFIKIISARDHGSDIVHPIMVRRNAIAENMKMIMDGRFNERVFVRPFHGRGSLVRVIEGNFLDRRVCLEIDIPPTMRGNIRVPVSIDGIRAVIELHKLAL